jgi:hypothetical protein
MLQYEYSPAEICIDGVPVGALGISYNDVVERAVDDCTPLQRTYSATATLDIRRRDWKRLKRAIYQPLGWFHQRIRLGGRRAMVIARKGA